MEGHELESPTYENTALFLVSCFQYILVAGAFSIGPPYRKSMWTNGMSRVVLMLTSLKSMVNRLAYGFYYTVIPIQLGDSVVASTSHNRCDEFAATAIWGTGSTPDGSGR